MLWPPLRQDCNVLFSEPTWQCCNFQQLFSCGWTLLQQRPPWQLFSYTFKMLTVPWLSLMLVSFTSDEADMLEVFQAVQVPAGAYVIIPANTLVSRQEQWESPVQDVLWKFGLHLGALAVVYEMKLIKVVRKRIQPKPPWSFTELGSEASNDGRSSEHALAALCVRHSEKMDMKVDKAEQVLVHQKVLAEVMDTAVPNLNNLTSFLGVYEHNLYGAMTMMSYRVDELLEKSAEWKKLFTQANSCGDLSKNVVEQFYFKLPDMSGYQKVQIKLKDQKVDRGFLELQIDDPMVDCTITEHDEYNVAGARGLFQDMCLRDLEYSFMISFQETPWDPGGLQLQLEGKTLEMLSSPLEMLSRQNLGLLVVMVLNTHLSHKLSVRNSLLPEPLSHQVRFDVEDFQLPVTSDKASHRPTPSQLQQHREVVPKERKEQIGLQSTDFHEMLSLPMPPDQSLQDKPWDPGGLEQRLEGKPHFKR